MNAGLVRNWNSVVQPDDTVGVLGDFDMHGKDASLTLVQQLVGTKVLEHGWDHAPVSAETLGQHLKDLLRGRIDARLSGQSSSTARRWRGLSTVSARAL